MITQKTTKLYCVKDYSYNNKCSFHKDNYYRVNINPALYSEVRIYDYFNRELYFYVPSYFNTTIINNHFITKQELRKLKLEKLNDKNF